MDSKTINGFTLVNPDKIERALNGSPTSKGNVGGVAKPDGTYDDDALIAEYDRLGGYITDNGIKVKTGSFYDFTTKSVRKEPEITLIYPINGEMVEFKKGDKEMENVTEALKVVSKKTSEAKEKRLAKRKKK